MLRLVRSSYVLRGSAVVSQRVVPRREQKGTEYSAALAAVAAGAALTTQHEASCDKNDLVVAQDDGKAVELYTKAAEQGDADAQYNLAYMYQHGRGVAQDYGKAVELYTKAADQKHADAQCQLGTMCGLGGVSASEAAAWNASSAHDYTLSDDPIVNMADDLEHGDCIVGKFKVGGYPFKIGGYPAEHWAIYDKNEDEVIELTNTRKRNDKGKEPQTKGCLTWGSMGSGSLGSAKVSGSGHFATVQVIKPSEFFSDWSPTGGVFRVKWADGSDMPKRAGDAVIAARNRVGEHPKYTLLPEFVGSTIKNTTVLSSIRLDADAQYLMEAAAQGDADAQNSLLDAQGSLMDAADQGDTDAQYSLGCMYQQGLDGVAQDDGTAVELWTKAADHGDADAQYNLGYMYQHGRGVAQDDCKAVELYTKAADQEHACAQCNLGYMYQHGRGVAQDDGKAVELYTKAADQGHARAQCNLGNMYQHSRDGESTVFNCESFVRMCHTGMARAGQTATAETAHPWLAWVLVV
jgi:TPR repeat protein